MQKVLVHNYSTILAMKEFCSESQLTQEFIYRSLTPKQTHDGVKQVNAPQNDSIYTQLAQLSGNKKKRRRVTLL